MNMQVSYAKNPIQNERDLTKYKFTLHQMNHIEARLHPRTHISDIFHCVSAVELFKQHEAQFGMWLLTSAWFHGPGNGA